MPLEWVKRHSRHCHKFKGVGVAGMKLYNGQNTNYCHVVAVASFPPVTSPILTAQRYGKQLLAASPTSLQGDILVRVLCPNIRGILF